MRFTPKQIAATMLGASAAAASVWVYRDYRKWLSLGPGGLPSDFGGWIETTRLRLRKRDALDTSRFTASREASPEDVFLHELPCREGARPAIGVHPVPHRQLDQLPNATLKFEIEETFDAAVARFPGLLEYQLSFFERRNRAVTLRDGVARHPHADQSRGEIAHVHPSDGSMHMILSAADARSVIEARWGESHPLAGVMLDLPETYLLIYPPRNLQELAVTERILNAAIAHMAQLPAIGAGAPAAPDNPRERPAFAARVAFDDERKGPFS